MHVTAALTVAPSEAAALSANFDANNCALHRLTPFSSAHSFLVAAFRPRIVTEHHNCR
jgi:hypothetical protein